MVPELKPPIYLNKSGQGRPDLMFCNDLEDFMNNVK